MTVIGSKFEGWDNQNLLLQYDPICNLCIIPVSSSFSVLVSIWFCIPKVGVALTKSPCPLSLSAHTNKFQSHFHFHHCSQYSREQVELDLIPLLKIIKPKHETLNRIGCAMLKPGATLARVWWRRKAVEVG